MTTITTSKAITTSTTLQLQLQPQLQHYNFNNINPHYNYNYEDYYNYNYCTTLHPGVVSEATTATITTTPKGTAPTTFRSISGFTLPSMRHNKPPLL